MSRALILFAALSLATPAWAQFAVEDVYVGVQTSLQAINGARALVQQGIQMANEAQMIKNQIEQLAYAAANLTKSPLQLAQTLGGLLQQYEDLLRQSGGIGFEIQGMNGRVATVYPILGQTMTNIQQAMQQIQTWLWEIRHASVTAMSTQAIASRLQAQRAHLQVALLQSENAPGQLAVIQDTNQILGIIVEQNASLHQTHAASARAQTAHTLAHTQIADQVSLDAAQHVSGLGAMVPVQPLGIPAFR